MAEDVSEETLTSGLTLLVKVGKVFLKTAKQDAEGTTEPDEGCSCSNRLHWVYLLLRKVDATQKIF